MGSWWGNRREGEHWGDLGADGWILFVYVCARACVRVFVCAHARACVCVWVWVWVCRSNPF